MNWTRPADLLTQVQRLWDKGDLLRDLVEPSQLFPLRLPLKGPASTQMAGDFPKVRAWIAEISSIGLEISWREFRHRLVGTQRIPQAATVADVWAAIDLVGRRSEAENFLHLVAYTREHLPALLPWVRAWPQRALAAMPIWPQLISVAQWVWAHPRPNVYLRQVDLPGVHTKFIEENRAVLADMLDAVLAPADVDPQKTGVAGFAARYGFRRKPVHIRFRALDTGKPPLCGAKPEADIQLDAESFAQLNPCGSLVFITENEANYLAFPAVPDAMVIFGCGYGWEALGQARWLAQKHLFYWGDIDTHGFAILDRLRGHFPHAQSLLMDEHTLMRHQPRWSIEPSPYTGELHRLNLGEAELYAALQAHAFDQNVRLEQELLPFEWCSQAIRGVLMTTHAFGQPDPVHESPGARPASANHEVAAQSGDQEALPPQQGC